jgi:hypothetical protein
MLHPATGLAEGEGLGLTDGLELGLGDGLGLGLVLGLGLGLVDGEGDGLVEGEGLGEVTTSVTVNDNVQLFCCCLAALGLDSGAFGATDSLTNRWRKEITTPAIAKTKNSVRPSTAANERTSIPNTFLDSLPLSVGVDGCLVAVSIMLVLLP